jgi:hypothetical protein
MEDIFKISHLYIIEKEKEKEKDNNNNIIFEDNNILQIGNIKPKLKYNIIF